MLYNRKHRDDEIAKKHEHSSRNSAIGSAEGNPLQGQMMTSLNYRVISGIAVKKFFWCLRSGVASVIEK
ncbi:MULTISPECIES: hypothetical protein [unclassified Xanthomonas]|uniref:hypothetical protein n=1 Tax=unclassified Xanthomonas TaxID=2643310 RepID=UPI002A7FB697|nr:MULTISPECIES: hypothetical protein [unclassified Xanthomonas]MDY4295249.1 hypothetical protein [Xanthomonas sp. LF02-5]MDY4356253.1 hypothetical protein [Xanthomonas sp. LF04-12]